VVTATTPPELKRLLGGAAYTLIAAILATNFRPYEGRLLLPDQLPYSLLLKNRKLDLSIYGCKTICRIPAYIHRHLWALPKYPCQSVASLQIQGDLLPDRRQF